MKITNKNKQKKEGEKPDPYPNGRWHTGKDRAEGLDGVLIPPPEKTRYSMTGRRDRKKVKSKKLSPLQDAAPKTVWMRKDIWKAVELFKEKHDRSQRSIIEEAVYNFLIKEHKMEVEDMGEDPSNSSWKV